MLIVVYYTRKMETGNRKTIANRETVFKACDELLASGTYPTQAKVLKYLGGGSPNTIAKYHRNWTNEKQQDKTNFTVAFPPITKEIQYAFNKFYAEMYQLVERLIVDERLAVITELNEQQKKEIEKLEMELINYQEMKGRVKANEANQAQLVATLERQSKEIERQDRKNMELQDKIKRLEDALEKILSNKLQNNLTSKTCEVDMNSNE